MSLPVLLRPAAEDDLKNTHDSLEQARSGLGRQFLESVREVLERIEAFPRIHAIIWQDVRAVRIRRFRYVVYYVVLADRIEVLAILHGARDASAWRSRV